MMTLRQVRYFVAVAEAGSVTAAAAAVGISQSAVTEALKQLEDFTGVALFERRARGLALTHHGHQFLHHAHNILAAVADAQRALQTAAPSLSGTVHLGVTSLVAGYFLADLLARFRRVFPNVAVEVHEDVRDYVEHLLVNGELDLGLILVSNMTDRDALDCEVVVRSRNRLWLAPNHPLAAAERIALADIVAEPLIQLDIDEMAETARGWWQAAGLAPRTMLKTGSVEAVRSLVATGAGIAVMPDMAFRPWSLEGDRLDARILADQLPSVDVGLVWRRGSPLSLPARTFVELSREHGHGRARRG
ncbi:MAG: LysR family transcriptional regulator [Alphaproteobacteria bacterium]|nr:LysR family transcriptional regulator [Alphaproteobacteria bacterium]